MFSGPGMQELLLIFLAVLLLFGRKIFLFSDFSS